ncbi:MAG TPA: hypothetical protein VJN93_09570 [Candidatus Acidoferrum sp.]|nr:hypothetical protein [Candidatus Acidoferrum sp.]
MSSATGPNGSLVMLWAGEDPALHSSLLEELESAGIPYIDKPTGEDEVAPTSDPLPIDWKLRFGFEVAVPSSNFAAAEQILDRLLNEEPADLELPASDDSPPPAALPPKPSSVGATTSPVWSGTDPQQAKFLAQALKENEIPVRLDVHSDQTTLYVPPEEETLAREIIREILEGTPPA